MKRLGLCLVIAAMAGCSPADDGGGTILGAGGETSPATPAPPPGPGMAPQAGGGGELETDGSGMSGEAGSGGCTKMDILFVIDNSGSMGEEQSNLVANFPRFIEQLDAYKEGALDYRVGVTTTAADNSVDPADLFECLLPGGGFGGGLPLPPTIDSADKGALVQQSQCGMSQAWLEGNAASASIANTFSCNANVGTNGSGEEKPLLGARLALVERVEDGTNAGFLRDDALLAIIILTDEDDQSSDQVFEPDPNDPCAALNNSPQVAPVDFFVQTFDAVKGGRERWATAVIAGSAAAGGAGCSSSFGDAEYAARLDQFVQQTGENAVFSSICEGDLSIALQDALNTFEAACTNFTII